MLSLQYISLIRLLVDGSGKSSATECQRKLFLQKLTSLLQERPRKLVPLEEPTRDPRQTTLHLLSMGLLAMPCVGRTDPNTMERRRGFHNMVRIARQDVRSFGSIIGKLIFAHSIDSYHEETIAYPSLCVWEFLLVQSPIVTIFLSIMLKY